MDDDRKMNNEKTTWNGTKMNAMKIEGEIIDKDHAGWQTDGG